jgi:hypothetical protein
MSVLENSVSVDQPLALFDPDQHTLPGSATALESPDFVRQPANRRHRLQPRASLPSGVLAATVATVDFCLVSVAAAAAFAAYSEIMDQTVVEPERHVLTSLLAATLFAGVFERLGGYRLKQLARLRWQLTRTLGSWAVTVSGLLLVAFLSKTSEIYSRGWALAWIITAPVLLLTVRCLLHAAVTTRAGGGYFARNIAIIGAGNEGERLIARLQEEQDKSVVISGVFDDRRSRLPGSVCGLPVRGTTDDLLNFARRAPIDEVIMALPLDAEQRLKSLCDKMKALAIDVRLSLEPLAETFNVRGLGYVGTVPVLEVVDRPLKNWCAVAKWMEDNLFGSLLLVFVGPLMVLIEIGRAHV